MTEGVTMIECGTCYTVQPPGERCENPSCGALLPKPVTDPRTAAKVRRRRKARAGNSSSSARPTTVEVVTPTSLKSIGAETVLHTRELAALNAGSRRVFALMSDWQWHTADAIRCAAGENGEAASEGLRRMRELRSVPGVDVERRRAEGRLFEYRLRRV